MSDNKPTVRELNIRLKELVKWQVFALNLPGIEHKDIEIIESERDDVDRQKIALFVKWIQVYPNASWADVAEALEKAEEIAIAQQLRRDLSYTADSATKRKYITQPPPTVDHVFRLLRHRSSQWNRISKELGISRNQRQALRQDSTLSNNDRLKRIITIWIQSSPVTWKHLISVLKSLGYHDVIQNITDLDKSSPAKPQGDTLTVKTREVPIARAPNTNWRDPPIIHQCSELHSESQFINYRSKLMGSSEFETQGQSASVKKSVKTGQQNRKTKDILKYYEHVDAQPQSALVWGSTGLSEKDVTESSSENILDKYKHGDFKTQSAHSFMGPATIKKMMESSENQFDIKELVKTDQQKETKDVSDKMEVIFEDSATFTADSACCFSWERYGCRLSIPKGAIRDGEQGIVQIYGIHSGPFEAPKDMKLVSAIYYIILSHELLKPATLEIEHCCNTLYSAGEEAEGECNLTFLTVSADNMASGSPYRLQSVSGGQFGSGGETTYGVIKRTSFSPYVIAFINWVKYMLGYPLNYGVLYCLIATADDCHWRIVLRLTEYIAANETHFLKKEEQRSLDVRYHNFKMVRLTSDTLVIDVSRVGQSEGPLGWDGNALTIAGEWEIMTAVTGDTVELLTSEIGHELAPSVEISVQWKTDPPPIRNTFRIHYLGGLKEKLNFPVTIPYPSYRQQFMYPSSTIEKLPTNTTVSVLLRYKPRLLGILSEPNKLADELVAKDLLSPDTQDRVSTTLGISRYDKTSLIVDEIVRYFEQRGNDRQRFLKFCRVLQDHDQPLLDKLAEEMEQLVL